jgi:hypothetical protein
MEWITAHYQDILFIIGSIVTTASAIVALTPSTKDDEFVGKIVKFLEYFSVFNKKTHV